MDRRTEEKDREVRPPAMAARGFQPIIDALTAHVALLDGAATIVAVNRAWMRFSDANQNHQANYGIGSNYLALLDATARCPCGPCGGKAAEDGDVARRVAEGLRQVLAGSREKFQMEYPCDSPTERRWYLLTITPFPGGGALRAVVAHEDLTPLKLAQEASLNQAVQLAGAFSGAVEAIVRFIEKRDPYTAGHQHQVATLCQAMAETMGLPPRQREGLILGAKIHDIGKIAVPVDILCKPGKLSAPEMEIIRMHPQTGYDILQDIPFPWPIAAMVAQHHERLDGTGYPNGLKGDAICLEARIIAVADVFDAITSHRPYRPARDQACGIEELLSGRGRIYDSRAVDALLAYLAGERAPFKAA